MNTLFARVLWIIGCSAAVTAVASGAQFDLSWYTIDSGGAGGAIASTGGGFELSGTIGQFDAGVMTGGTFDLTGGFWAVSAAPLPCDGDANGDGLVDPLDSGYVLSRFGCDTGAGDPACDAADVNGSGLVDPLDVGYVLSRFGPCE